MKTKISSFLLIMFGMFVMSGCGATHYYYVNVGKVDGDVWARKLGSRSQMRGGESEFGLAIPIEGIPTKMYTEGDSPLLGTTIRIEEIGGSLYIEEAFVGTQNVPIPEAFRALYKNSNGDPFAIEGEADGP